MINFNVLKLINSTFTNKFLVTLMYINKKTLNPLFLKFYFLLIQKPLFNRTYFFFNFFFYKKLWITLNFFTKNFYYKIIFKKFYKKYFFINKENLLCYNYNVKNDCIFFSKNNKNYIIKRNFFFFKFLNFKLISFLFNIIKDYYFFNFYFNIFFINYFTNLNNNENYSLIFNFFNNNNNPGIVIFKSIRHHSNSSLLKFNKLI